MNARDSKRGKEAGRTIIDELGLWCRLLQFERALQGRDEFCAEHQLGGAGLTRVATDEAALIETDQHGVYGGRRSSAKLAPAQH